jgi:hypothetical protein
MVIFPRLLLNNGPFKQAWNGLVRRIQTTVEHMRVTNTEAVAMARGHVVALIAGQRQAEFAGALDQDNTEWVGVITEPIAAGDTGIARIDGYAYVLFEDNLTVASGEAVYVSETPGLATNVTPATPNSKLLRIGTIGDDTMYVIGTLNACGVWLQHPSCAVPGR